MNYKVTIQLVESPIDSFLAGNLPSTKIKHDYHEMEQVFSALEELATLTKL